MKSDVRGLIVADISERVFRSVMADCIGDYVSVNYLVEPPSPQ